MSGVKKLFLFVVLTLQACFVWQASCGEGVGGTDGMTNVVKEIMHVGTYCSGMHSGDLFFYPLSPGLCYGYADLMALQRSGDSLLGDIRALDRLYLFSKLTGEVFACDSVVRRTNEELNDWDFDGRELHLLTSPTYNGRFLLAVPFPLMSDSTGKGGRFVYHSEGKMIASAMNSAVTGSGTLVYFRVSRPWLDGKIVALHKLAGRKLAIVEGIILARNLQLRMVSGGTHVKMKYGSLIVGYCCRIL